VVPRFLLLTTYSGCSTLFCSELATCSGSLSSNEISSLDVGALLNDRDYAAVSDSWVALSDMISASGKDMTKFNRQAEKGRQHGWYIYSIVTHRQVRGGYAICRCKLTITCDTLRNKERTMYHQSHPLPFLFHLPQWSFLIVVQLRRRAKRLSDGFVHVKRASSVASRGLVNTPLATLGVGWDVHCRSDGGAIPT
jgi:hypothetical protein